MIAMRPDKKLAGLLGLSDSGSSRTGQYMKVNTSTPPGAGITADAMQFKGVADDYMLNGAVSVAELHSDASTATSHPAVSYREVGSKGGLAAAFTYDLAKSVIAQHQGNRAWAGTERDGSSPIRTNDLFYGAKIGDVQPDWTDMSNVHIPQADEQQRLLVNVMTKAMEDTTPMPRFWYLPHGNRAALVMAGDDHALPNSYGTEAVMNSWLNESATGCSLEDWGCVRASHYVYDNSALTNTRAVQYDSFGFEIGVHPLEGCGSFLTYGDYSTQYSSDLAAWRAKFTGLPDAQTSRVHCYTWGGWDITTQFEQANAIRYDLNYVAYPGSWVNGRGALLTGSGMNMRLTLNDGSLANVRQGVTNLDNTSAPLAVVNAVLDNAVGPAGYYGVFGTHYDMNDTYDELLYAAARARNIPMITAEQAADWFDGREHSQFADLSGETGRVTFSLKAAESADGLKAMVPVEDAAGTLTLLQRGGAPVSYQSQTIKGVNYATFDAVPGNYEVRYSDYSVPGGQDEELPESRDDSLGEASADLPADNDGTTAYGGKTDVDGVDSAQDKPDSKDAPQDNPKDETARTRENKHEASKSSEGVNWLLIVGGSLFSISLLGGIVWVWRHRKVV